MKVFRKYSADDQLEGKKKKKKKEFSGFVSGGKGKEEKCLSNVSESNFHKCQMYSDLNHVGKSPQITMLVHYPQFNFSNYLHCISLCWTETLSLLIFF